MGLFSVKVDIVWFKRDFRLEDHAPINEVVKSNNNFLGIFVIEPSRLKEKDTDPIHIDWEIQCAVELQSRIRDLGGEMLILHDEIINVFENLSKEYQISNIYSHEEIGTEWSYRRDIKFGDWCKSKKLNWIEFPTNAVIRGLNNRDNWYKLRTERLMEDIIPSPNQLKFENELRIDSISSSKEIGIIPRKLRDKYKPGEIEAKKNLDSFLNKRGMNYRYEMSSPITGENSCSRLSHYISTGCITIRQIIKKANERVAYLKTLEKSDSRKKWIASINSFKSRLAWHCHFIQKLELQPTLGSRAMNHELDRRLNRELNPDRFEIWKEGKTGWPFFDACMRQLRATGWINFRMRAMLMSVASYTLWLPWKESGNYLARQFIDYEPGIHWSQVSMQSGTTGINTVRAYSILKQSTDHDPDGKYIRKWVPELTMVPTHYIHEPWKMSKTMQKQINCVIGENYPRPIVDEKEARLEGVSKSYKARGSEKVRKISREINAKHGSRKGSRKGKKWVKGKQTKLT